jgi:hypothetical protein
LLKVLYILGLAAVATGILFPGLWSRVFAAVEKSFRRVAMNRKRAMLAAALFPMLARAAMLPWYPPPRPQIHDEFSYLLQGDTFAHGRIANPVPPYWQHFESEYVLLQPSYASQYQPAQGLVLAFGEVVLRNPWLGVWLSMGIMCALFVWALSYIFPPVWALFGAFTAALQFGIFGLWMNSYFGGAVAASAGALIAASIVRVRHPNKAASSAALCAVGIIVLFASRPFEALVWSLVAAASLFVPLFRLPRPRLTSVFWPFAAVFLTGAALLAFYNWRITGNPANPPYLAYQRIYGTPQPFWWQPPIHVSDFRYSAIRDNYLNQLRLYDLRYSPLAMLNADRERLRDFWRFFIGPFFTPALLFLPLLFKDKRVRPWLWISVPFILDKATYHAWFPAQSGPSTILILIVLVQCWRHMLVWWRARRAGLAISRQLITACCLAMLLGSLGRAVEPVLPSTLRHLPPIWESLYPARRLRDDVTAKLESIPGKHLLFVKYSPDHCFCEEWVFNSADIEQQRIVYARPYSPESDEDLARALPDHDVWLVEPDENPYRLTRMAPWDMEALYEDRSPAPVNRGGFTNDLFDLP